MRKLKTFGIVFTLLLVIFALSLFFYGGDWRGDNILDHTEALLTGGLMIFMCSLGITDEVHKNDQKKD